jgi:hypothetical protein
MENPWDQMYKRVATRQYIKVKPGAEDREMGKNALPDYR